MKKEIPEYKRVISYIEDKIKAHELIIGSKLPTERAIAEELGISRNSAREAFIVLDSMGIIERVQGSGSYISINSKETVSKIVSMGLELGKISEDNIFEFRRVLERSICIMLADKGIAEADISELKQLVADMDTDDLECRLACDISFHNKLVRLTENPLLYTLTRVVNSEFNEGIKSVNERTNSELRQKLVRAHEDIISSILTKEKLSVLESVEAHYNIVNIILDK